MTWAFLTRAKGERDLIDELGERNTPRRLAEGLVVADQRPRTRNGDAADPAFARQAMRVGTQLDAQPRRIAGFLAHALSDPRDQGVGPWMLQVIAPDSSDPKDPRRRAAEDMKLLIRDHLKQTLPEKIGALETDEPDQAHRLAQVWLVDPDDVICGVTLRRHVMSVQPGGKLRFKRPDDAPSRSGLKLEEAIDWIGVGPGKGDLCVDLGAAPGGWSQVAVGRGATVIAVDPARLKIELPKKRFAHVADSAFDYVPAETLDWLLCDMAWRPLEVAQLLAKWGRRVWATQMIVNLKLPMKQKARVLKQCLNIVRKAGWEGLRVRQLYYDRDEVTLFAFLNPGLVIKGYQAPFEFRARANKPRSSGRSKARGRSQPRRKSGSASGRKDGRRSGGRKSTKRRSGRSRPTGRR